MIYKPVSYQDLSHLAVLVLCNNGVVTTMINSASPIETADADNYSNRTTIIFPISMFHHITFNQIRSFFFFFFLCRVDRSAQITF